VVTDRDKERDGERAAGVLYVVATPIGNLEDITYRAVRVLGEVSIIAAEDTRAARKLLSAYRIAAPRLVSLFAGNEAARTEALGAELAAGASIALISEAGTPVVSDPGARLVARAWQVGAQVQVVPGPSAAIAALVGSGLPAARFSFIGFPPRSAGARRALFGSLRAEPATLIVYEAPDRVAATLADLSAALGADRPAALARELTKRHEEHVRGSLGELAARYADAAPRGECTLVVQGADPGAASSVRDPDIEGALRELLARGLGPKDAAARLVVTTGKPRRHLYQLALSLRRERRDDDDDDDNRDGDDDRDGDDTEAT
jgi:16S rRNA (cytidine1402-2'-O)-methyltransferase